MSEKFIDNTLLIVKNFSSLYKEQKLTDLCLVVNGKEFHCHRLILSASSDVFQVMLMNSQWPESFESRVELIELQECAEYFNEFLYYFYTGQIEICMRTVLPFLILSDKYNVETLREEVINFMMGHTAQAAVEGYLSSWIQIAHNLGYTVLEKKCCNFVKWNLNLNEKRLLDSSQLSFSDAMHFITFLLRQSDLVVHNEFTLYRYVLGWLEAVCRRFRDSETLDRAVTQVLSYIRYGMISPAQLDSLQVFPLSFHYSNFFQDRLMDCTAFHTGNLKCIKEILKRDNGYLQMTPRLYTSNNNSSILTIENYSSFLSYQTSTLVFSSHTDEEDPTCEWVVEVHPKGVRMKQCYLIEWQGKREVPEVVIPTVRVSITCKDPPLPPTDLKVKIGLLIYGVQNDIECVLSVIERVHYFSEVDPVLRLDDVIPFHLINLPPGSEKSSQFLVGESRDEFKMRAIIQPTSISSSYCFS